MKDIPIDKDIKEISPELTEEIKFTIKEGKFKDKNEAILRVCYNQIGPQTLPPRRYEMLVGIAYNMAKNPRGGNRGTERDEHGHFIKTGTSTKPHDRTREKIARAFGTTPSKVRSAAEVAAAVMEAEKIQPGFRKAYESGEIKATKQEIKKIPTVDEEKKPEAVRAIMENDSKKKEKLGISKPAEPKQEKKEITPPNKSVADPERVSCEPCVAGRLWKKVYQFLMQTVYRKKN